MTDHPANSLVNRARRLASLARARSDDQKEFQSQGQVETALRRLDAELGALANVLALHTMLRSVGVPVGDVVGLVKPAQRLLEQVRTIGRPTAQFLHARVKDVESARKATSEGNVLAWQPWAGRQIEALPLALVPRLVVGRAMTDRHVSTLKRLAVTKVLKSSEISDFMTSLNFVKGTLDKVGASEIDAVLARFANGRIKLAALTDDELAMLRSEQTLADQLYVQLI